MSAIILFALMQYQGDPISWFQKMIRGNALVLSDHISKEMNELNLIRCQKIPKRPGADWRDLPDEKVSFRYIVACKSYFLVINHLNSVFDFFVY